ncbi:MAG: hypothetical protein A3K06_00575 [Candidatus Doudnabacteria bacterium RIFCSPHIGHO2_01_52_17]|uniref:Uncharacterized protein n=1 Tax=Candidatus Doudnabacteria bacterium RIFCSPHIGHO2_01_52_17 TaxID=1817820 RepID=A0A1F5NDJ4_9BACT|nr:MAG: hypothetical protein A3K06_00575 [Candidatus Doudnabacteria bacterium RIFCSPHIGHO2_01_52_17]
MKPLADSLSEKFSRRDDLSRQLRIVKVFDLYREAVAKIFGSAIALPRSLKRTVLSVETSSAAAASELRLREGEVLEAINVQFKSPQVTKIIYRF